MSLSVGASVLALAFVLAFEFAGVWLFEFAEGEFRGVGVGTSLFRLDLSVAVSLLFGRRIIAGRRNAAAIASPAITSTSRPTSPNTHGQTRRFLVSGGTY